MALRALQNNYIWITTRPEGCLVIDPGEAKPVLEFCERNATAVHSILITHHHQDHTGGIRGIMSHFPDVHIIGPTHLQNDFPLQQPIDSKMTNLSIAHTPKTWQIIHTPGHTLDHICYRYQDHLFCADTLFSAGCGRVFEGSYKQMFTALQRIASMPDSTHLYPAHEYTIDNLSFAEMIEPNNNHIKQHKSLTQNKLRQGQASLPTVLRLEKKINPFLRTHLESVKERLEELTGAICQSELDVFTGLRKLKDDF